MSVDWLLQGLGDSGVGRDLAWDEAVGTLRSVWRHPRRRRMVLEVLRALDGRWGVSVEQALRPGVG